MPHVQANLDAETFKRIKKDAIDKDQTMGDYVKDALKKQLEETAEKSELNNETSQTVKEINNG